MHVAEIIPTEILHLQPKISDTGGGERKLLNLILKTFMGVCINPLYFLVDFFFFRIFFSPAPARSLMKLKCQVRVALYHVLSIKGREAFCICC